VPVAIETHLYSFWEKRIEKHGMAVEAAAHQEAGR
jgi:hypothetical protein